ncbi:MAG: GTP cyclohydrolase I FolE2 [Theionarchaea archaeon]|nr:GTP cyclohydrolase I FolE2 [Theionarchaea archaeon]MBU7020959.1 GTP cyclohydrolase I FolE2 [Theionarchaea archaeon]
MNVTATDVHYAYPSFSVQLSRVGIKGIKRTITQKRGDEFDILRVVLDVSVDLPVEMKGVHMSRNVEAVDDIVENMIGNDISNIEDFCIELAKALLERHEYATFADVTLETDYTLEKETVKSHRPSQSNYKLTAGASIFKDKGKVATRKRIGVEVPSFMVCPCAQELMKTHCADQLEHLGLDIGMVEKITDIIPMASHGQRGISRLIVETDGDDQIVEARALIDIIERSVSAPTFELMKREDEIETIIRGHRNPQFVEDAVREILRNFLLEFSELPDSTHLEVYQENLESIHSHNVFSEKNCTLGELREQLQFNGG